MLACKLLTSSNGATKLIHKTAILLLEIYPAALHLLDAHHRQHNSAVYIGMALLVNTQESSVTVILLYRPENWAAKGEVLVAYHTGL